MQKPEQSQTIGLAPPWWASEESHIKHARWVAETQRQLRILAEKMEATRNAN